jgi:hypothetical protein
MAVPASWNDLLNLVTSIRWTSVGRSSGVADMIPAFKSDKLFAPLR